MLITTLVILLFFGGAQQNFLIDNLEKGIKKVIDDKDRKKEILAELKDAKSVIKAFNKAGKASRKEFKAMSADRETSRKALEEIQEVLREKRQAMQHESIEARLSLVPKITEEEWGKIIDLSNVHVAKQKAKAEKKSEKKPKDDFRKVRTAIEDSIQDPGTRSEMTAMLESFIEQYEAMNERRRSLNVADNELVGKQDASREELQGMFGEMNALRDDVFRTFLDYRFKAKALLSAEEWDPIAKELTKVMF